MSRNSPKIRINEAKEMRTYSSQHYDTSEDEDVDENVIISVDDNENDLNDKNSLKIVSTSEESKNETRLNNSINMCNKVGDNDKNDDSNNHKTSSCNHHHIDHPNYLSVARDHNDDSFNKSTCAECDAVMPRSRPEHKLQQSSTTNFVNHGCEEEAPKLFCDKDDNETNNDKSSEIEYIRNYNEEGEGNDETQSTIDIEFYDDKDDNSIDDNHERNCNNNNFLKKNDKINRSTQHHELEKSRIRHSRSESTTNSHNKTSNRETNLDENIPKEEFSLNESGSTKNLDNNANKNSTKYLIENLTGSNNHPHTNHLPSLPSSTSSLSLRTPPASNIIRPYPNMPKPLIYPISPMKLAPPSSLFNPVKTEIDFNSSFPRDTSIQHFKPDGHINTLPAPPSIGLPQFNISPLESKLAFLNTLTFQYPNQVAGIPDLSLLTHQDTTRLLQLSRPECLPFMINSMNNSIVSHPRNNITSIFPLRISENSH